MNNERYPKNWIKSNRLHHSVVLAIDPTTNGIGYTVFRGPHECLESGTTDIRLAKNTQSMKRIRRLVRIYGPSIIISEDITSGSSYRCKRVQRLIKSISEFCTKENIEFVSYSPDQVKEVFSNFGATTKHEIACKIAQWLPEFESALPNKRKCFEPEHLNYGVFDAVALTLTYFYLES